MNIEVLNEKDLSGISGVSVKVYDKSNRLVVNNTTNSEGAIEPIPICFKITSDKDVFNYTPHKIIVQIGNASKTISDINMDRSQWIRVLLKTTPPKLNLTYPPDGLTTNQQLIYISGDTDSGAVLTLNGHGIENRNGFFNTSYWLNEGNNTLVVEVRDNFGNSAIETRIVRLKTIPPSLEIDAPKNGVIMNTSPVNVTGKTNGTRIEINGKPVQISANGSFSIPFKLSGEGPQIISITAWDDAGNFRNIRLNVVYDINPPYIEIISPINGTITNKSIIILSARVQGASTIQLNGKEVRSDQTGYFEDAVSLKTGENLITIHAMDLAGNANQSTILVILDNENNLKILEPSDNLLVNISEVTIKGICDLDANVTINGFGIVNRNGNFTHVLELNEGPNTISIVSVDRAKNYEYRTVHVIVDTIPPKIVIMEPTDTVLKAVSVRIKILSEINANLTVNGQSTILEGMDIFIYLPTLNKGINKYFIVAKDTAGNTNSTVLTLTYIPPKPPGSNGNGDNGLLPTLIIIIIIVMVILGIAFNRKKRPGGQFPAQ